MSATILQISFAELCNLERLEHDIIVEIVNHEIVTPIRGDLAADWVFEASAVPVIKKAARLATDFEIDWIAVSMMIELMQQKEALERENAAYRLQLERFIEG